MIRIEQFLFEKNVEPTQAESLTSEFSDLSFSSMEEFESFFKENNIRLVITSDIQSRTRKSPEKVELLQRFKEFKSSTDYDYVKKYIAEQRKIQALVKDGNFVVAKNLLDGISLQPVDPFFNFVVRKMLTGSPNGVLPSENLKTILDDLTKQTKPDINTEVDVTRDDFGKIITFDNYLKNEGSVRVDLLDERFSVESLRYVIPNEFTELDEAVQAEKNVLRIANEVFQNTDDLSSEGTGGADGTDVDEQKLIENLKKLIVEDSNSKLALEVKLESEKERADGFEKMVFEKNRDIANLREVIIEVSSQAELAERNKEFLNETIVSLNETINSTLSELEGNVSEQLTNTADAFDALATQLETQAKKSEEAAAKQLAAFEKAVGGIADALKPAEPEPEPGDSPEEIERKNTIKNIQSAWEKILYINTSNDDTLLRVLTLLKAETPIQRQKFVDLGGNMSSRIKQIVDWNNLYKKQYRSLLTAENIKTLETAKSILKDINTLETKTNGFSSVRTFIYDQAPGQDPCTGDLLDKWRNDCIRGRGSNEEKIREIYGILGVTWENGNTENIEAALKKTTNDQFLEILNILSELPTKY
jgi:hypothetical protein